MKQIIFLTLLIAAGTAAFAQERDFPPQPPHYEYTGETFSIDTAFQWPEHCNFTASDYILLNPGFDCKYNMPYYYNNGTSWPNYCTTDFKIDENSVYPPYYGQYGGPNPDDKGCVGAIGGNIDVSSLGGALYSIPIEVPAGINGMQPNLAVTYNSQGGNGLLGWCWDLSGLSSITRSGKTLYHDNVMGGVTLNDENDRFFLDGQRLIEVADYNDSIEYRTEQDGMARIMAYCITVQGGGLFGFGTIRYIADFKVWQSDGIILEYGFTDDSRIEPQNEDIHALCWLMNKVSDRDGNSIIYHYEELQSSGQYYLQSIDYTWNDIYNTGNGYKPDFTILLKYNQRNRRDFEYHYVHGNLVKQNRLLSDVFITKNKESTETISHYSFQYSYNEQGQNYFNHNYNKNLFYHRLTAINLEKGGNKLNPTKIQWGWDLHPEYQQNAYHKENINSDDFDNFIFTGDFNADGFSDVITVPYKTEYGYLLDVDMKVYLNTGGDGFAYSESLSFTGEDALDKNLDWIHVADLNGDGYDDIIVQYEHHVVVYLNHNAESFEESATSPVYSHSVYSVVGDFLGNGRQSLITFNSLFELETPAMTAEDLIYCDCDNICRTVSIQQNIIAWDIIPGDFDGDGHTDLFFAGLNRFYNIDESNNTFLLREKQFTIGLSDNLEDAPSLNLFPGDFNGDGLCDLLCYGVKEGDEEAKWHLAFSTGCGFEICRTNLFYYEGGFAPREKLFSYSLKRVDVNSNFALNFADFDGDGHTDIACCKNYENVIWTYSMISIENHSYGPNDYDLYGALGLSKYTSAYCRGQYLHVGNFFGKDNMSFLTYEASQKDNERDIKPILLSLYSINEYNSVARITDGLGNKTEMQYQYLVSTDCHQELLHDDVFIKPLPFRTLSSITTYNVSGNPMTTQYSFHNPLFHKNGHGYLGFAETGTLDKQNGEEVSRTTSEFEIETMGAHAYALPSHTKTEVYLDEEWKDSYEKTSTYRNVTSTRDDLIVCPALMGTKELYYNIDKADNPDDPEYLHVDYTEYGYSFGDGNTYYNSYSCTETKQGVDDNDVANADVCEFRTVETDLYYTDVYDNDWIINKLHNKVLVQSRTGKPNVEHCWWYEYYTENPYQLKLVYDIPFHENNSDPLTTQTNYEYYPEGNLKKEILKAPHAQQGEPYKTIEYEYGPGEGTENEHRLVSKETVSGGSLSYETSYQYDLYDNVSKKTASNGLETEYETHPLLVSYREKQPDNVENVTALRWVRDGATGETDEYAPDNALYYCWTKSSGGLPTKVYYHKTGKELREVNFGLNYEPIITDRQYDERGRLTAISNPHFKDEDFYTSDYHYDDQNRLISASTPDGTVTGIVYEGPLTKSTVTSPDGQTHESEVTVNAMSWAVKSEDASHSFVEYDHYADGLLASAVVNGNTAATVSVEYDNARNRYKLTDPNYGTLETTYNAYGELKKRVTPKEALAHTETSYGYDDMGRLITKTDGLESTLTSYSYDNEPGCRKGTVKEIGFKSLQGQDIQTISYEYDGFARPIKSMDKRQNGLEYESSVDYDDFSRPQRKTFPTGVTVNYGYRNGYLNDISNDEGVSLWHTDSINAFGQLVQSTMGDKIVTHRSYDDHMSYLDSIVTSNNLQNLSYSYDKFGNLASRKDNKRNLEETFTYDNLNRLTGITMNGMTASMTYDNFGRMTGKEAVVMKNGTPQVATVFSSPVFDNTKIHALVEATMPEDLVSPSTQDITYSSFDKVTAIDEGDRHLSYRYGYNQQRIALTETNGSTTRKKQYVDNCEFVNENGIEKSWTFLSGPYGVFAVVERQDGEENTHFILKDHLGSWTTVTDAEGNVEQELSYDAWGNLRDPETWYNHTQADPVEAPMFDRGYTGHEHMTLFGLINMNGRCYDPIVSGFLSVDACLQDPSSAQGFNRYAYCAYNPLRYTDPTGWYMGGGDGSDDYPPFAGYVLPEVTVVADAIDTDGTTGGGDAPQGNSGGSGYYPYTPTVPNVPDGHSGTPASQGGSSYYPAPNNGNNGNGGNGGHGTGGKPQGNSSHGNTTNTRNNNVLNKAQQGSTILGYQNTLINEAASTTIRLNDFKKGTEFISDIKDFTDGAGKIISLTTILCDITMCVNSNSIEQGCEYFMDGMVDAVGLCPMLGGLPIYWRLIGKQLHYNYVNKAVVPMIKRGDNPGLMINQPFK